VCAQPSEVRLAKRYEKFRYMGRAGVDFIDEAGSSFPRG
jgi:hypothetical protein